MRSGVLGLVSAALLLILQPKIGHGQAPGKEKIIIDTDIGDDVDDAFAVGLALSSPELEVVGITTAWGDTATRARLVARFLHDTGRCGIPVAIGAPTRSETVFTERAWAEAGPPPDPAAPSAADFILQQARRYPGEITLVAIAPLTNVAAAIARDPGAFRKLKRVVMMGGSIHRGYGGTPEPSPEYNIASDAGAAQALLASGVAVTMMPLDSTEIALDDAARRSLFAGKADIAAVLAPLYEQWSRLNTRKQHVPVLYDVVPVATVIAPDLCPATKLRIAVDGAGYTRPEEGAANAAVCLDSKAGPLLRLMLARLSAQKADPSCPPG